VSNADIRAFAIVAHIAVLIDVALLSGAAHGQMFQCPAPSVPVSGGGGYDVPMS